MNPPTLTVYGIPNCDTVKKARTWLTEQGHAFVFHDFKKAGVPTPELDHWLQALGWDKLLNRQGTTWRKLDPATQAAVTDSASARALMLSQPSVIKRPVVDWGPAATPRYSVGFKADDWAQRSV
ncbi:ArsC family reductase [Curvibacter sp. HBC61]|uniref:ArsC family reductase n=1 Tax=Curvibacter cyanobacteriorum TaxID=3026422 RepID=A0ABT5N2C5_9BURK|nr:ArsC family reductase [Curvibacter sp. HBC61]MDD0840451.1 ArsC family reductase [Curvibacter sp. HBC61]